MPRPLKDLVGQRFGHLVALRLGDGVARNGTRKWVCRCDCGQEVTVDGAHLRRGGTRSCGCLARSVTADRSRTHGMTGTPEFNAWQAMRARCHNPKHASYPGYGGRGITVCEAWRESFERFYADVGPRPSPAHSIDRIDNDRGYEPGNVRWADQQVQAINRRSTRLLEHDGRSQSLSAWAAELGISVQSLSSRLQRHDVATAIDMGSARVPILTVDDRDLQQTG